MPRETYSFRYPREEYDKIRTALVSLFGMPLTGWRAKPHNLGLPVWANGRIVLTKTSPMSKNGVETLVIVGPPDPALES